MDPQIMETRLFDYPVHLLTMSQCLERIEAVLSAAQQNLHVVTLNPEMIMQADHDLELAEILRTAGLVIPDGTGVVWALKVKGYKTARLPGIELSESILQLAERNQYRVAFVGAQEDVLAQAIQQVQQRFPGLHVVYQHHGFFASQAEEAEIAQACANTQPQVLFVAMGVPKQEKWIKQYAPLFQGALFVGVGGSLDVWSGKTNRAPAWMRRMNLEWLYRITTEPWRIRRIYKSLPMFVVKVLLQRETKGT